MWFYIFTIWYKKAGLELSICIIQEVYNRMKVWNLWCPSHQGLYVLYFFMNALKFLSHVEPKSWEKNLKSYAGSNPDKLHAIYYGKKT